MLLCISAAHHVAALVVAAYELLRLAQWLPYVCGSELANAPLGKIDRTSVQRALLTLPRPSGCDVSPSLL